MIDHPPRARLVRGDSQYRVTGRFIADGAVDGNRTLVYVKAQPAAGAARGTVDGIANPSREFTIGQGSRPALLECLDKRAQRRRKR